MAKKPEDNVQTAADPIVDRDADKDAAKLRGEEKALAGKIVGAKKTADEAAGLIETLLAKRKGAIRPVDKKDDLGANDPKPEDDLEKRAPTTEAEAIDAARSGLSRVMRGNS